MSDQREPGENEFSRLFNLGDLGRHGVIMEISAEPEERAALARRFGLVAIDSLAAEITITRGEGDPVVKLRGRIAAEVVQSCVVTLEPVANAVEGIVEMAYTTEADLAGAVSDMAPDDDVAPDEDDRPEFLDGDEIDVGEVVAEHLGLHLDPYPRRGGVAFPAEDETMYGDEGSGDGDGGSERVSPFAVLRDMKQN
jgi:uncharacterized metal-binding protein YceD (DUF177 family)